MKKAIKMPEKKVAKKLSIKVRREDVEEDEISEETIELENNNQERKVIKCSLKEHFENDAVLYCQECRVYICNKCEKTHSSFLKHHHSYSLDKNIEEIFTGLCLEKSILWSWNILEKS